MEWLVASWFVGFVICWTNALYIMHRYGKYWREDPQIDVSLIPGLVGFSFFPVINLFLAVASTVAIINNGGYRK